MSTPDYTSVYRFHDAFFGTTEPTPLIRLTELEQQFGIKGLYVKSEAIRYGLPAFKVLGASWGTVCALSQRTGVDLMNFDALRSAVKEHDIGVHAATDGNHGRAVARTAARLGMAAYIYVPKTVERWSIEAIESEGCKVTVLDADYDEAVRYAAAEAERLGDLLVQDTAWEEYQDIPQRIVEGYTRIFAEIGDQLGSSVPPTHVIVPVGVGSLALSAAMMYEHTSTTLITVEPNTAACLQSSLRNGNNTPIITGSTIMPGLNCGTVSSSAWPVLKRAMDPAHAIAITDEECQAAMVSLAEQGVPSGPCGAAPLAAMRQLKLGQDSVVVLICTEGPQQR